LLKRGYKLPTTQMSSQYLPHRNMGWNILILKINQYGKLEKYPWL
jgi:hypothetical protein